MRVQARFTRDRVPFNDVENGHLILSLQGEDAPSERARPRLGIIPVIDRTGSMASGDKLKTALSALDHLVGYMGDDDLLGLVAFSDMVTELVTPGVGNREAYRSALSELRPRGMTNLAGGLTRGVELAKHLARELAKETSWFEVRVILLSDGLANVGVVSPEMIARIADDLPFGVRVTTIGVGRDCDHDLLNKIAKSGGGGYGFAENADAIPGLLGGELGSLLTLDASDIKIRVSPRETIELEAPIGVTSRELEGNGFEVRVPTILAGEDRHIVLPFKTVPPGRKHARRVSSAEVTVSYAAGEDSRTQELLPKLFFDGSAGSVAPTLQAIVDQAVAGAALQEAEALSRAGEWGQARVMLRTVARTISTPGVSEIVSGSADYYTSSVSHTNSAAERVSTISAMGSDARLLGSSDSFDAQWARSMGDSYTTNAMRDTANDTRRAVQHGSDPDAELSSGNLTSTSSSDGDLEEDSNAVGGGHDA